MNQDLQAFIKKLYDLLPGDPVQDVTITMKRYEVAELYRVLGPDFGYSGDFAETQEVSSGGEKDAA